MGNYNPFSLEGKTILVTGASSGIGQATAIECSKMGAKLVITGRNAERLQQTFDQLEGEGHQQIIADLTDAAAKDEIVSSCPELSGLVLCAGQGMTLPFQFCSKDKIDALYDVNFFAPVELFRLLSKKKKLAKASSVVAVASTGGTPGGRFTNGNAIYGSAKAALVSMMKYAARELAPRKIRVNMVNPAMTETPLVKKFQENITEEQIAKDMAHYPLGRYGRPTDIAHGIIYLLSDASSWVTGHALVIDGGVTI